MYKCRAIDSNAKTVEKFIVVVEMAKGKLVVGNTMHSKSKSARNWKSSQKMMLFGGLIAWGGSTSGWEHVISATKLGNMRT